MRKESHICEYERVTRTQKNISYVVLPNITWSKYMHHNISFYGWDSPMHCCFHLCTYARPNSVLCPSHVFFLVLYLLAALTCCCWQRKSCKHVYTQVSAHPESLRRGRVSSENIWGEQKLDGANSRGWGLGGRRAVYDERSIVAVFPTSVLRGRWTWMLFSVLSIEN